MKNASLPRAPVDWEITATVTNNVETITVSARKVRKEISGVRISAWIMNTSLQTLGITGTAAIGPD